MVLFITYFCTYIIVRAFTFEYVIGGRIVHLHKFGFFSEWVKYFYFPIFKSEELLTGKKVRIYTMRLSRGYPLEDPVLIRNQ